MVARLRLSDAVTGEKRNILSVTAGVELDAAAATVLKHWEVLQRLNELSSTGRFRC